MLSRFRSYSKVAILTAPTNIPTSLVGSSFVDKPASGFEAAPPSYATAIDLLMTQQRRTRLAFSYSGNHAPYKRPDRDFLAGSPAP